MPDGSSPRASVFVHPTADVAPSARLGPGTKVWSNVQVRERASVGEGCVLGRNVFVGLDVSIGDHVKIQNNASVYEGVRLADGVFVGPHVVFTNDKVPRAVNPDGSLKSEDDWTLGTIDVLRGAAIGAGAVIVTGVTIGAWSMIGSGAIVTADVPDHALVVGSPGRVIGWVSARGVRCASQDEAITTSRDEGVRP
jgi:acetyltransferase-like isoleucine patch superfamily enzyme